MLWRLFAWCFNIGDGQDAASFGRGLRLRPSRCRLKSCANLVGDLCASSDHRVQIIGRDLRCGFHVWDPGGAYGDLRFVVLRRIYLSVWLINKEIDFILRLNALWFGVKDGSSFLFNFLLFFVPYKMMDIILYFYNESQLDNCTVSTTIECIGEQRNLCFWDEDSLHQLVVVLFFYF